MKRGRSPTHEKYNTEVRVTGMRSKIPNAADDNVLVLNCTSRSKEPKWRQFSPFLLGPVMVPLGATKGVVSKTHENAWQYSKVYSRHVDKEGEPTADHWKWAEKGFHNPKAVRFPMGKGAKPEYSIWNREKYGYVEARKKIYAPTYAELVMKTPAFKELKAIIESGKYKTIWFRDFDGYDSVARGMSLKEVINEPKRKMGHSFVLAGCLKGDTFWE